MMGVTLKIMFIYYQFMILDDKYFSKCVCLLQLHLQDQNLIESSCTYVVDLSNPPSPHFYDYRLYTRAVLVLCCICVFSFINRIRNVKRFTTYLVSFIQNTTTNSIKVSSIGVFFIFQVFALQ